MVLAMNIMDNYSVYNTHWELNLAHWENHEHIDYLLCHNLLWYILLLLVVLRDPQKLLHRSIIFCQLEKRKSYFTLITGLSPQKPTVSPAVHVKYRVALNSFCPGPPGCPLIRNFQLGFSQLGNVTENTNPRTNDPRSKL